MKKRATLLLCLLSMGLYATAQRLQLDNITSASAEAKANVRTVVLTGTPSAARNGDFRQLRDLCFRLEALDLSQTHCPSLPPNALFAHKALRTLKLPQTLQTIGNNAFFACDALSGTLTLPATLREVGASAFSGCRRLQRLVIEADSLSLGPAAFAGCTGLKEIRLTTTVPPAADDDAFAGIDPKRCHLDIPFSARRRYAHAPGWRHFFGHDAKGSLADPEACLVPKPLSLKLTEGAKPLRWRDIRRIEAPKDLHNERQQLARILRERLNYVPAHGHGGVGVKLQIDTTIQGDEAYVLAVSRRGVTIRGSKPEGVFRGITTLEQLIAGDSLAAHTTGCPALVITDRPRTALRELMLDPARIFIPYDRLRAFIPEMARYKFNALHLHLVDDQGWRVEIKKYPRLTQQGATRVGMDDMLLPISGYYTQQQLRDLVAYAATFHIQVIPEIEMPGHETAAIHCYPRLTCSGADIPIRTTCGVSNDLLCPGEDFVYEFLGNVFRELADIFPSPYVHLGGDEAGQPPLGRWTDCPKCQALKRRLGIDSVGRAQDNWRLQQYLFNRVIDTLQTRYHKTPMFWYETDFKEIPSGCVTLAWRHGLTQRAIDAARENRVKILLCPGEHCYLDYPMSGGDMPEVNWGMPTTTLEQTYRLDPAWGNDAAFERDNLLGVAGTLWTECIPSTDRLAYMAWPRGLALAEAGWSAQSTRSYTDFLRRLRPIVRDLQRRSVAIDTNF